MQMKDIYWLESQNSATEANIYGSKLLASVTNHMNTGGLTYSLAVVASAAFAYISSADMGVQSIVSLCGLLGSIADSAADNTDTTLSTEVKPAEVTPTAKSLSQIAAETALKFTAYNLMEVIYSAGSSIDLSKNIGKYGYYKAKSAYNYTKYLTSPVENAELSKNIQDQFLTKQVVNTEKQDISDSNYMDIFELENSQYHHLKAKVYMSKAGDCLGDVYQNGSFFTSGNFIGSCTKIAVAYTAPLMATAFLGALGVATGFTMPTIYAAASSVIMKDLCRIDYNREIISKVFPNAFGVLKAAGYAGLAALEETKSFTSKLVKSDNMDDNIIKKCDDMKSNIVELTYQERIDLHKNDLAKSAQALVKSDLPQLAASIITMGWTLGLQSAAHGTIGFANEVGQFMEKSVLKSSNDAKEMIDLFKTIGYSVSLSSFVYKNASNPANLAQSAIKVGQNIIRNDEADNGNIFNKYVLGADRCSWNAMKGIADGIIHTAEPQKSFTESLTHTLRDGFSAAYSASCLVETAAEQWVNETLFNPVSDIYNSLDADNINLDLGLIGKDGQVGSTLKMVY